MSEGATVDLLDANLLIALAVTDHMHHGVAEQWARGRTNLATCPITQGSLVRFMVRDGASGPEAVGFLAAVLEAGRYRFWADDLGYDRVDLGAVLGHRQVTDAYLVAIVEREDAVVATFDAGLASLRPERSELVSTE